jgi:hypothetical protein
VLYLRATLPGATTTALLRASDGGTTVRELTRLDDAMRGFALSDDGRRVFVGSPDAGLLRAVDGGAFARVAGYQVQCLRFHAGALYVCANELADGFALGRSTDDGAQVTALLRLGELREPNTCPAGSTWTTRCAALWALVQSGLRPLRDAGPDTGPVDAAGDAEGGADGSTGRPGPTDAGRGCACGVVVRSRRRGRTRSRGWCSPWACVVEGNDGCRVGNAERCPTSGEGLMSQEGARRRCARGGVSARGQSRPRDAAACRPLAA